MWNFIESESEFYGVKHLKHKKKRRLEAFYSEKFCSAISYTQFLVGPHLLFLWVFGKLKGNKVGDMPLTFPNKKYKSLQGSNIWM